MQGRVWKRRGSRLAASLGAVLLCVGILAGTAADAAATQARAARARAAGETLSAPSSSAAAAQARRRRCRPTRRRSCRPVATQRPVRGGTLVVALSSDPGQLNPAITTSGAVHPAAEPMFNGLVSLEENGTPVPELAQSWRVEEGGSRYTFSLRRVVRWHDVWPVSSAVVK